MTEFLDGKALADKIREVVTGDNVKCAVAFWGKDMAAELGVKPDWKIICDVKMGGTSADALRALGAPNNQNLTHVAYLHAKVYISSLGAVIGSANASINALGRASDGPKLTEVGVFYEPNPDLWERANEWFDELFRGGAKVDDKVIAEAERTYTPPHHDLPVDFGNNSFLDLIAKKKKSFSKTDFRFLVAREYVEDQDTMAEECTQAEELKDGMNLEQRNVLRNTLKAWPAGRIFKSWPSSATDKLNNFFEFFTPKDENPQIFIHRVTQKYDVRPTESHFYTHEVESRTLKGLARDLKLDESVNWAKLSLSEDDWKVITKIQDENYSDYGHGIFTPQEFADLITKARGDLKQA